MNRLGLCSFLIAMGFSGLDLVSMAQAANFITPNTKPNSCLKVRKAPNKKAKVLDCSKYGEIMIGYEQQGDYLQVRYKDSRGRQQRGYVYNRGGQYVKVRGPAPTESAASESKRMPLPKSRPALLKEAPVQAASPAISEEAPVQAASPAISEEAPAQAAGANIPLPPVRPADSEGGQRPAASREVPLPPKRPIPGAARVSQAQASPKASTSENNEKFFAYEKADGGDPEVAVQTPVDPPRDVAGDQSSDSVGQVRTPKVDGLRLRSAPNTNSKVRGKLYPGMNLEVIEDQGDWFKVSTPKGEGYVSSDYVSEPRAKINADDFVEKATSRVSCDDDDQWQPEKNAVKCLICNMHFEAGNQRPEGRKAVNYVVFNRVAKKGWPNTICGVIYKRKHFSWANPQTVEGKKPLTMSARLYNRYLDEAREAMGEYFSGELDPSSYAACADHYYNPDIVTPEWKDDPGMRVIGTIQNHLFLKRENRCFNGTDKGYLKLAEYARVPRSGREVASVSVPLPRARPEEATK